MTKMNLSTDEIEALLKASFPELTTEQARRWAHSWQNAMKKEETRPASPFCQGCNDPNCKDCFEYD